MAHLLPSGSDYTENVPDFSDEKLWAFEGKFSIDFLVGSGGDVWNLDDCVAVPMDRSDALLRIGIERKYCSKPTNLVAIETAFFGDQSLFMIWYEVDEACAQTLRFGVRHSGKYWLVRDHDTVTLRAQPVIIELGDGRKIINQIYFEICEKKSGKPLEYHFKEHPEYPAARLKK